jgi:monoamine oxidase
MQRIFASVSFLFLAACPPAPTPPAAPPAPPPAPAAPPPVTIASSADAPQKTSVVIIGGGLAGLVTAYELKKAGVEFHLLEMQDVLGGRVQTAYYEGGLRAEYGLQEVWEDNPLYEVMKELKVPIDGKAEPPFSSMVLDGKLYPFVQDTNDAYFASMMKPDEVKALNEWRKKTFALREAMHKEGIKNAEVKKLHDVSFAKWVQSFKMSKRVNDWIRLTIECELAQSWEIFSAAVGVLEYGVFLGDGLPNYKVDGGNSKLIEALAEKALPSVTTGAMVTRVDRRPDKVTVSYIRHGKQKTIDAERVVVAVPPWRLHQIHFEPTLGPKKWEGINSLMRGSYTVVHMIVNKEHQKTTYVNGVNPFPYLTDGVLGVIYGAQSEAPADSPNEVFAFLVHGNAAYAFHMQPREAKIKEMLTELDKLFPGFSKHYVTSYVYTYHPGSITVWPVGRSPIDEKSVALRTPEDRLVLVGDWLWSGHSDGAARSAIDAAKWITADLKTAKK